MNKDYNDFILEDQKTPNDLAKKVHHLIYQDLNPSHKNVFFKLILVHSFIGTLTMIFCPQFNLSLTNSYELFHYFHRSFGHEICMMICGGIFLGSGVLFAVSILSESEIRKVKESSFLYYTAMSIAAVSSFGLLGATIYLNLLAFWLIGAILTGALLFNVSSLLRKKLFWA